MCLLYCCNCSFNIGDLEYAAEQMFCSPATAFLSEPPERVMTRSAEPVIGCTAAFYLPCVLSVLQSPLSNSTVVFILSSEPFVGGNIDAWRRS